MRTLRPALLPLALVLTLAACKKDKDKEPSKTDILTSSTWKESQETLKLNSYLGTRATPANNADTYQFTRDGKVTVTPASGTATTGSWALVNNETQLTISNSASSTTETYEIFELTKNSFSIGVRFTQAQIQTAVAGGTSTESQFLRLLMLSAGGYTYPPSTPTIPPTQLTSMEWGFTMVPK